MPDVVARSDLPACAAFPLERDRREAPECLAGGIDHHPHRFEDGAAQQRLASEKGPDSGEGNSRDGLPLRGRPLCPLAAGRTWVEEKLVKEESTEFRMHTSTCRCYHRHRSSS
jgi:hypothetical protein